ncbi:MAG: sodium/proline symporter [Ruminococcaceae bacterium]|nr:sodium/proline symporter [Oscillospiraceae bacterium]
MNVAQLLAFGGYMLLMLGIGIVFFVKSKNYSDKDYFLGGRQMGPWVTALSAQASDMSAWLLMGLPGSIIAFGMGEVWIAIGLALGTAFNWIFVASRLRKFSKAANDSITLPQYLTNRFASTNPALKIVCAVVFLVAFTVYVASAFVAGRTVFTAIIPGLDPTLAIVIFAVIVLIYTFLGGYKAVCWTDFFQGMLMLIALVSVPIIMVTMGNFGGSELYNEIGGSAFEKDLFSADWRSIVTGLSWGLGYVGMPHILVRFMAIEKPSMVKKSATVAIIWVILSLSAAALIAVFGRTWLLSDGVSLAQAILPDDRNTVFIRLVQDIFPGAIAGILLSAIIAASMSTADSQLLVASSSFTSDIYKPMRKDKASDKEVLWVGRAVVAVVAVVAFFIATSGSEWAGDIMNMVENAWGLFGAAFGPVVILSLFWKRFNFAGALAGIVCGALADIAWLVLFTSTISEAIVFNTGIYEILPGFIVGMLAAVVVTLITKAPGEEVAKIYETAVSGNDD